MADCRTPEDIPLPDDWPKHVRSAVVHVISLAYAALTWTRSWAANSPIQRVRLAGQLEQANSEIDLLKEEMRIKDARMSKIEARHRPYYPAQERMAETLARAGLHLAVTTVGRMLKNVPQPAEKSTDEPPAQDGGKTERVVTAKRPNHVWNVDLTLMPTGAGFWVPWVPFSFPQAWPGTTSTDHTRRWEDGLPTRCIMACPRQTAGFATSREICGRPRVGAHSHERRSRAEEA